MAQRKPLAVTDNLRIREDLILSSRNSVNSGKSNLHQSALPFTAVLNGIVLVRFVCLEIQERGRLQLLSLASPDTKTEKETQNTDTPINKKLKVRIILYFTQGLGSFKLFLLNYSSYYRLCFFVIE